MDPACKSFVYSNPSTTQTPITIHYKGDDDVAPIMEAYLAQRVTSAELATILTNHGCMLTMLILVAEANFFDFVGVRPNTTLVTLHWMN
jgi:hypothetical protein